MKGLINKIVLIMLLVLSLSIILKAETEKEYKLSDEEQTYLKILGHKQAFPLNKIKEIYGDETLYNYFTDDIYKKLKGNEIFGYYYKNKNFKSKVFNISLLINKNINKNIQSVIKREYLKNKKQVHFNSKATTNIKIAVVYVQQNTEDMDGLIVEYSIINKQQKAYFFHRFINGSKKGLNEAIKNSMLLIFAQIKGFQAKN